MNFMDRLKLVLNRDHAYAVTENGAAGYQSTGKALLDLHFAVSSLRNCSEAEVVSMLADACSESLFLAVKWLFYAGDVRGGLGERRLFNIGLKLLAKEQPELVRSLLPLVPYYTRYDNLLILLDTNLRLETAAFLKKQLEADKTYMKEGKSISLCAKWMPSANGSSKETRRLAHMLTESFGISEEAYRKQLSELRSYIHVTEVLISAGKWAEIPYEAVPSKANLLYRDAFLKHDEIRRRAYLDSLKEGGSTIHADVLFPHDIVGRYIEKKTYRGVIKEEDETLEALWAALPDYVRGAGNTICVCDGSGSMMAPAGNTQVTCMDVANALAVYFSERCTGQFHNRYITFSEHPQFVDFSHADSLRERIIIARKHSEIGNTNIEAVFDLILSVAIDGHMKQEEMPANILILSDMEFDGAVCCSGVNGYQRPKKALFAVMAEKYADAGYRLPRMVFWNICSRTRVIPLQSNDLGVALVSGFSATVMNMVLSGKTDPLDCLMEQLETERYQAVEDVMAEVWGRKDV